MSLGGILGTVGTVVGGPIGGAIGGAVGSLFGNSSGGQSAGASAGSALGAGLASQEAAQQYQQQAEQAMQQAYTQQGQTTQNAITQLDSQIAALSNPATAAQSPYLLSGTQLQTVTPQQINSVLGTPGQAGTGAVPTAATGAVTTPAAPVQQPGNYAGTSATSTRSFAPTQTSTAAAPTAAAPTSTVSPQTAIQNAVQQAIAAEGSSGSYGTYANNIKANLANSGAFTPAQLTALDNSPWIQSLLGNTGTMSDIGGGNANAFLQQGTSALLGNLPATSTASPAGASTATSTMPSATGIAPAAPSSPTAASPVAKTAAPIKSPVTAPVSALVGDARYLAHAGAA